MEKLLSHQSYRHSKRSSPFQGNLTFTVLCLIALSCGIAALSLKNNQYKRYCQRIHRNYFDEKQALELCFAAFKKLKEAATKDAVITYEKEGKIHFVDAISKEDLVNLDEILFENSAKISVFSDPEAKNYIPCLPQSEGVRQTLEELFQQEIRPEPLKNNYPLIRNRWFSLKNNTALDTSLFEPYLKAWDKLDNQLKLTFLNPFDRSLKGKFNLTVTCNVSDEVMSPKSPVFDCSLKPGGSVFHNVEIKTEKNFSNFTICYGTISVEKTLRSESSRKTTPKWRRLSPPAPEPIKLKEIIDKIYFKTQTPLQCLNTCLFFHETLEPIVAFGKKDEINKYFWNNVLFDKSAVYFNLNANEVQLKQKLEGLFEESVVKMLCEDILKSQPFYDIYSFTSKLSQDLASHWNALDSLPIFVLREESFIIEAQLKSLQKNVFIRCRLWVHREIKSDKEREWSIDQIEYKRF